MSEWKGCLLLIILVYHVTGGDQVGMLLPTCAFLLADTEQVHCMSCLLLLIDV